jgi:hypothetical protein
MASYSNTCKSSSFVIEIELLRQRNKMFWFINLSYNLTENRMCLFLVRANLAAEFSITSARSVDMCNFICKR